MTNVFQSLLLVIAGATQKELARQVKYLKVENEILRSKLPKRITVTPKEKNRLVRFALKLGGKRRPIRLAGIHETRPVSAIWLGSQLRSTPLVICRSRLLTARHRSWTATGRTQPAQLSHRSFSTQFDVMDSLDVKWS
jgi:hypothetical protein